jgi:TP901 family phage tail tape measure protein
MANITTLFIKVDSNGVVTASKNLKGLKDQANKVVPAVAKVTAGTKALNTSTKATAVTLASASSGLKTVGRDLNRYSLLLAGAGTAVAKFSFDLSKGLGQVQTLIPDTGNRIFELEDALKDLSVSSGVSLNNLTEGLYQTISAFQDSADTIDIFTQATEASIAGNARVVDSIELASAVTKAYGDTTAKATQKVFDLAFETVRLGQTTFPQLANGIQTATDSAVRLGISQEELFATFSALTGVIGDASEVATKFRSASASLLNPNENLLRLFKALSEQTGESIKNGKDFVKVAGGWQEALALVVDTAEKAGQPLQTYIRRIEGITLASRLAGNSAEKYASDLEDANNAVGASKRSYDEVKEGIDSFRQSILESRQQIIVAATEIGENLVPRLAELLAKIADAVTSFSNMDDELQHFIITVGASLAVLGPFLILLGSIARAIKAIQALKASATFISLATALGGPAGLIAILAVAVTGFLLLNSTIAKSIKTQKELSDAISSTSGVGTAFNNLATKYETVNDVTTVNRDLNKELVELYPELSENVDIYKDSLGDVYNELVKIKQIKLELALQAQIDTLHDLRANAREAGDAYADILPEFRALFDELGGHEEFTGGFEGFLQAVSSGEVAVDNYLGLINRFRIRQGELNIEQGKFAEVYDEVLERIESTGLFDVIADEANILKLIPKTLQEVLNKTQEELDKNKPEIDLTLDADTKEKALKTWQEWFEQITGVAKERFGNSGKVASEEFIAQIKKATSDQDILSLLIGEDLDNVKSAKSEIDKMKSALLELVTIAKDEVKDGEIFEFDDKSIRTLIQGINEATDALKGFQAQSLKDTLKDDLLAMDKLNEAFGEAPESFDALTAKADVLGEALEKALELDLEGTGFVEDLKSQLSEVEEALSSTFEGAQNNVVDFFEKAQKAMFEFMTNTMGMAPQVALAISEIGVALLSLGIDGITSSFEALGNAFADGVASGKELNDILADQALAILEMLPQLFIQAGLQLIASGNYAVGIGFVAAGLTSSFLTGLAKGKAEADETANAQGNAFSGSNIIPFASGGSFTNSVIDSPTNFAFANGGALGLMGEAGPEAILPLSRTSSGNLGVETTGMGGANISINIINNTGSQVQTKERKTPDGTQIEVIIGQVVGKQLANGKYDSAMQGRYGTKVKGIAV